MWIKNGSVSIIIFCLTALLGLLTGTGQPSPESPQLILVAQTGDDIRAHGYCFLVQGPPELTVDIKYSTDLAHWTTLQTVQLVGTDQEIVDHGATNSPGRFYRAVGRAGVNPFVDFPGDYPGLFYPADLLGGITGWADVTNSGFVHLTLTTNGTFSGELVQQETNQFSGALGLDLQAQVLVARSGRTPLTMTLQLIPERKIITGSVADGSLWTSPLTARKSAAGHTNAYAGDYTLILAGCDTGSCFTGAPTPMGDNPATVQVSPTGEVLLDGSLAESTLIRLSTVVSEEGYWPLYIQPYQGRGLLIGWLNFVKSGGMTVVVWQKPPADPEAPYYPEGFATSRVAVVRPYYPPLPGQNAINWTNGTVIINGGNLPSGERLTNEVAILNNQLVDLGGSISNLTLTIVPSNGSFQGTFLDPITGQLTPFYGVVMQSSPAHFSTPSGGWFLGTNSGGTIRLHPQ